MRAYVVSFMLERERERERFARKRGTFSSFNIKRERFCMYVCLFVCLFVCCAT